MFEFLQFDIARHQIDTRKLCSPDDIRERPLFGVVADCAVERVVAGKIEFRLLTEHGRQRGLGIKIDRQHAVAA